MDCNILFFLVLILIMYLGWDVRFGKVEWLFFLFVFFGISFIGFYVEEFFCGGILVI